jgi:hypothetical protein
MSKKIQLSIPKPCHENWDAMTPVEKGRFCGSCQKQVVDFSNMSDRQVAEFFKKPSSGSVCGRFMTDQLEREIEIPKKRIPWLKYFFQFTIPAFLISLKASSQSTKGKIKITAVAKDTTAPVCAPKMGIVVKPLEIKGERGKVVDALSGEPLSSALITMTSTLGRENIPVKNDGSFIINYVSKITIHSIEISLTGYEMRRMTWQEYLNAGGNTRLIRLQPEKTIKGEIAINNCSIPLVGDTVVDYLQGDVEVVPVQQKAIKNQDIIGKIVDTKGNPVPHASILSGNPLNFVIADEQGEFTIPAKNIPADRMLSISSVGFSNTEARISKANEGGEKMIITLKDQRTMPEVVVTSMGHLVMGKTLGYICTRVSECGMTNEIEESATKQLGQTVPAERKFIVYPNPVVQGTSVHLRFSEPEEGYCQLQIMNASGQLVHQQQIWIDSEARLLAIDLPSLAAGNYFMVMASRKSGKKYAEKLIIQ